jgi:hypothetical protein
MKSYSPKIGKGAYIWLLSIITLLTFNYYENINKGLFLGALISTLFLGLIWYIIFIFPKYHITDGSLLLSNFLEKKTISIHEIRKIERNQIRGIYPILNPYQKGLVIHFNKYDDVFINPRSTDSFIRDLLEINPDLEII